MHQNVEPHQIRFLVARQHVIQRSESARRGLEFRRQTIGNDSGLKRAFQQKMATKNVEQLITNGNEYSICTELASAADAPNSSLLASSTDATSPEPTSRTPSGSPRASLISVITLPCDQSSKRVAAWRSANLKCARTDNSGVAARLEHLTRVQLVVGRKIGRIVVYGLAAVAFSHHKRHRGTGRDDGYFVLGLQAFDKNFKVQSTQKACTKERRGGGFLGVFFGVF